MNDVAPREILGEVIREVLHRLVAGVLLRIDVVERLTGVDGDRAAGARSTGDGAR